MAGPDRQSYQNLDLNADPLDTSVLQNWKLRIGSFCHTHVPRIRPSCSVCVAGSFVMVLALLTLAVLIWYGTIPCGPINRSPPRIVASAKNGDHDNVKRALKSDKGSVHERSCNGDTALIVSARNDDTDLVALLLDSGANPDAQGQFGHTALIIAAINDNKNITELLIAKEANTDLQDELGETALHHAAWEGNVAVGEQLLKAGCNTDSRERFGEVPLVKASYKGWTQFVRILIQYGADVNALDLTGETPLHNIAARGHLKIARLLLEAGTSPTIRDMNGQSALDIARANNHLEVAALIEGYINDKASVSV